MSEKIDFDRDADTLVSDLSFMTGIPPEDLKPFVVGYARLIAMRVEESTIERCFKGLNSKIFVPPLYASSEEKFCSVCKANHYSGITCEVLTKGEKGAAK